MTELLLDTAEFFVDPLDISHLIIEDDSPLDNIFSEREQRLLTKVLYESWEGPGDGRTFVAYANVGIFYALHEPPVVPDVLVSLVKKHPTDLAEKKDLTYLAWEYGKSPEVVVEIVSNRKGKELGDKRRDYALLGIPYYIVHDPYKYLNKKKELYVFELRGGVYVEMAQTWLPLVCLGVTLWQDEYEGFTERWLRWCDIDGELLPTGAERAEQQRQRAEQEHQRAEQALEQVEQEHQRAERLAAQLRALGIEPDL